jgi:hypothetical protein
MGDAGKILTGPVSLFRGAVDAAAASITTEIGYTEDGLQMAFNDTVTPLVVDEEIMPVGAVRTDVEMVLSFQIAQADLESFLYAWGLPADAYATETKTLTINPTDVVQFGSFKATGKAPSGGTRTWTFPKVAPRGQRTTALRKGQKQLIPVELLVFKPSTGAPGTAVDVAAS